MRPDTHARSTSGCDGVTSTPFTAVFTRWGTPTSHSRAASSPPSRRAEPTPSSATTPPQPPRLAQVRRPPDRRHRTDEAHPPGHQDPPRQHASATTSSASRSPPASTRSSTWHATTTCPPSLEQFARPSSPKPELAALPTTRQARPNPRAPPRPGSPLEDIVLDLILKGGLEAPRGQPAVPAAGPRRLPRLPLARAAPDRRGRQPRMARRPAGPARRRRPPGAARSRRRARAPGHARAGDAAAATDARATARRGRPDAA